MKNTKRWRLPRWLRILLFCVAALITLAVLLYVEENWRAERAWRQMKQEIAERGESLDWRDLVKPDVPDDQNFAMTPLLRPFQNYTIDVNAMNNNQIVWDSPAAVVRAKASLLPRTWLRMQQKMGKKMETGKRIGERNDGRVDLEGWRQVFAESDEFAVPENAGTPAEDVLFALKKYESEMAELTQASRRPYSQFATHYDESLGALLPYLAALKSWAHPFKLRAAARLAAGDINDAFEDVQTLASLASTLENEPLLITQLVRIALDAIAINAFWQGWADHRWSDEQLQWFQNYFSTLEIRAVVPKMYSGERAFAIASIDRWLIQSTDSTRSANETESPFSGEYFNPPRFIARRNQVAICRVYNLLIDDAREALDHKKPLHQSDKDYAQLAGMEGYSPYTALAKMLVPAVESVTPKFDREQVTIDLAAAACALERYRLDHGEYPDTLEALTPDYISNVPMDLMDGQPLRYHKRDDGWFDLYSVGPNQKDDGGVFPKTNSGEDEWDYPWPLPIPQKRQRFL